jgi:hypothetical protein
MDAKNIQVGDMVMTTVFVMGKQTPVQKGRVVKMTEDKSVSGVDIMSHHGGAPWIVFEATESLQKCTA